MAVILALIGVCKTNDHQNTRNSLLTIQMEKSSDESVGGTPGVNISDGFRGVTAPGSKSLVLIENNSGSRGGGWKISVGLRHLLGKVVSNLGI